MIRIRLRRVSFGILAAGRIPTRQLPVFAHARLGLTCHNSTHRFHAAPVNNGALRHRQKAPCSASTAPPRFSTLTRSMPSSCADLASSQLSAGTRNTVAPASCAATILWVMPPIEPTLPSAVMVPVPATNFDAVEVAGGQLVDDGQAEHQPRRRAADVGQVEVDGERRPRRVEHPDAEEALVACPGWSPA